MPEGPSCEARSSLQVEAALGCLFP